MSRTNYDSNTKWEPLVGYSRAVRVGDTIRVSGTTATDDIGDVVGTGDPYAQATQAIINLKSALAELGAGLEHVVRTRIYVVNIADWPEVGRAHAEAFADIRPATTMLEVRRLVDPEMLVEIEADAVISDGA
jgi:enamine deaminase RidA (YjgF/YER057c/UK114 family)